MERYRILRIYAKGAVLIEYKLERILSHVSKFIQMEAISQASSVRDNICGKSKIVALRDRKTLEEDLE